jgi:glutamyl-tRNA synthetase
MKNNNPQKVVTRFAPSPTGHMHIGGVRTALYAWAYARKHNGTFILRIEDTDKEREVAGSIEHIIASLQWLGITWDEGVDIGGPHAPYVQSQRLDSYKKYAQQLVDKGLAYADPYTKEQLAEFREQSQQAKKPFLYREYRPEYPPVWDGSQPLRLKITNPQRTQWVDVVRGDLSAGPEALDDLILMKSDGYPTYNFAHIIDDFEMGITHIMRADEFIATTPKFLAIYEALGITPPAFVTLPPLMSIGGKKKLGKRDGAKDILEYKAEGYLPEAMLNFLALIGWNPGTEQELFTASEFIEAFDLSHIHKSGGQYNEEKLDWLNREYIQRMSYEEQEAYVLPFLPDSIKNLRSTPFFKDIILLLIERISNGKDIEAEFAKKEFANSASINIDSEAQEVLATLTHTEVIPMLNSYMVASKDPVITQKELLFAKDMRNQHDANKIVAQYLEDIHESIVRSASWDQVLQKNEENPLWVYAGQHGRGNVLWPLRIALSGENKSIDVFEIMKIIGKEATLRRIGNAVRTLGMDNHELHTKPTGTEASGSTFTFKH